MSILKPRPAKASSLGACFADHGTGSCGSCSSAFETWALADRQSVRAFGQHSALTRTKADMIISYSKFSDVQLTYSYAWTHGGLAPRLWATKGCTGSNCVAREAPPAMNSYKTTALASLFLSNCEPGSRLTYLQDLIKHLSIDSYGTCLHGAASGLKKLPKVIAAK